MGKIAIIAGREFNERVRKKSFIITTILMPIAFVAIMFVPVLMMNIQSDEKHEIVVVDQSGTIAPKMQDSATIDYTSSDRTLEELTAEQQDIFGILIIGSDVATNPSNVQLLTYESSTINIESEITDQIRTILEAEKLKAYNIEDIDSILEAIKTPVSLKVKQLGESGETKESSSILNIALAYIFGFLIYMFVFLYGNMVMQGVIEEKSNKVMEVMVSSVKPFQLMMGKILGIASVAVTQFVIWVVFILVVGGVAMSLFGVSDMMAAATASAAMDPAAMMGAAEMPAMDGELLAVLGTITDPTYLLRILGGFLVYFIGGYLLYAAMFAAVGSAVDNEKDTNNLQLPITIPLILAIFVMMSAMQDPHGPLAFWFSLIPFTSPVVMMVRLPYGVPGWELALSIGLLVATFVAMVYLAGKIYRVGVFMYGKKPTLGELAKWIRYK
ncbi:MAG: ABC transporter permease [Tidjanibacter sp.]|nr:ABC transporter permease [Tidjanibacter sp.]MBQ8272888.1 ABC transporter permease [Tidjanibacter sp.]